MSEVYKSKYATDVKKLRFNGLLDRAFFGEAVVKEAWRMIYNNEVVFNRAFFELWSKNTIELEAVGTREEPLYKVLDVVSRKKDYDGLITEVVFEGADEVIEPNTTDTEKSGTFTIRQRYSNLTIVGTWTQKKDEVKDIEYQYVESVDISYDGELPATQSLVNPRVTINYVVKKYYSSNDIKTETLKTNGNVTYASGQVQNSSGAYINTSNGDVYSRNLGKNPSPYQEAYVVNSMSGTFQVTDKHGTNSYEWAWNGNYFIKQVANEKRNNGVAYYDFDPTLSATRITGDATDVYVIANAFYIQPTIWTSLVEDRDISTTFADLSVSDGTLDSSRIVGGNETTWHITKNGETARKLSITFSNSLDGYSETLYVDQDAYSESVTWSTPVLNGSITWQIPASGMAVPFYVPVIQYKVIDGVRQEPGTSWYAQATYVSGDVLNNSEALFSGGYISCETRGTNYAETPRDVFRAKVVKIEDLNGSEVVVNLPYSIVIKQSLNVYETRYGERYLSFTKPTDGSWVDSAGATVVVQVACYQESYREYSSLAREPLSSVSGEAKLSSNPTQSALPSTLANGVEARFWMAENTGSSTKSVQLTATYGSLSESVTVYQYAVSYALSITSSSSVNVAAQVGTSGKLIEFKGLSTRNGRPFVGSGNISVSVVGSTQLVHSIGTLVFDSETGAFTVPVTVYNNTSTSTRSLTLRVTQASSGYTETLTITQDAMVATDNIKWGNAYYYSGLQNTMTARLLFKSGVSAVVFYYKINGVTQGSVQNLSLVSQGTQGEWKYMDITRTQQFDYLNSTVQFVAEYNSEVETVTLEYKGGGDIT